MVEKVVQPKLFSAAFVLGSQDVSAQSFIRISHNLRLVDWPKEYKTDADRRMEEQTGLDRFRKWP